MNETPEHTATEGRWIGLREASRLLGVSPTTLRRWSDEGVVETFTTPGGHRRFDARSVRRLLPGTRPRMTLEGMGETPEKISLAYRHANDRDPLPWVGSLDERQRQAFREHGLSVARELLAYLDATTERDRVAHLATASLTAADYGVAAARAGLPASATVQTFLRFRRPFVAEMRAVARRRGLDTSAATDLLGRASDAMDELLVAVVRAYEDARSAVRTRRPGATTHPVLELPAPVTSLLPTAPATGLRPSRRGRR